MIIYIKFRRNLTAGVPNIITKKKNMNKRINNQSNIKKMNGWVSETIRKHNGPLHLFFPNPNCIEIWNYNIFLNFFKIIMSTWIVKAVLKPKKTLNKIVFGIYSQGLKHGNVIFFFFFFLPMIFVSFFLLQK